LAVSLHVQDDPDTLAVLVANNQVDYELKGLQGLAAASDQQTRIFAFQVDDGATGFGVVGSPNRSADVNLGSLEDPAYRFNSNGGCAGRTAFSLGYLGDSDPSWFATDAEKSRLAPT
jgi:hypothetical protein